MTNTGRFQKGHAPWNKGLKGLHFSPETQFKPGHASETKESIGTIRIRLRNRSGRQRNYIKTADPNTWRPLARITWEAVHGKIPPGNLIHHKDGDTLNDDLENLELVTREEHLNIHRPAFEQKRKRNASIAVKNRWENYRQKLKDFGKCECGEFAVMTYLVYQIRPSGYRFQNRLPLCRNCYLLLLEDNAKYGLLNEPQFSHRNAPSRC